MALGAVTFLLEKVKEVIIEYADLISGAENEFSQLTNELSYLKALLKDVSYKKDNLFWELERQVRDVVNEVEDSIDKCLAIEAEAEAKAKSSSYRRRLARITFTKRTSLAKEVKIIRVEKVLPLLEDAKIKYALLIKNESGGGMEDPRTTMKEASQPIRVKNVVGFEDEEATITGYLMTEKQELDVIPIIGVPGQGKTTLAWKIYESENICFHFPIRIWIHISQNFNCRDVFLRILRHFIPSQDMSGLGDEELVQTVGACMEKEKFLLVLDDVWIVDIWNEIKQALPLGNGKSKVLITSRDMHVGNYCTVYRKPHYLRFLTDEQSWRLLQYEVFGNLEDCPQELRGMGGIIAIKCDGVPLTIVVVGSILAGQRMISSSMDAVKNEWEKMMTYVMSESLQKDEARRIIDAVEFSYRTLPDDLRECFVYLRVFPEDYEISAEMLSRLWISEGFILPKGGRTLEETAEEILNDLIAKSLLKVEKRNHMGKAKTCRVPMMIRAFCMTKSKEEKLFQEIKNSKMGELQLSASELLQLRGLCFDSNLSDFLSTNPSGPQVRSFLCFHIQPITLEPQYISVIPDGFPKLRIMESKSVRFDQFPAKVTKLIHLRYLTLFIDNLYILPEAILRLWNLQTLIIKTKSRSITMKANIWKMIRLRHFKTKAALVLDNTWEGNPGQKNLQTLEMLSSESCTEDVSRSIINLKTLGISGKLADIFGTKFLEKLQHLEKLKLVHSLTTGQSSKDQLLSLPNGNCFPPYLKRLTLTNTFLDWKHMSSLAMVKSLEVLKLKDNAFVGLSWNVAGYNFPGLQILLIADTDLILWEASTDSFPSLRFLVVKNCEKLREIPECLGTRLQKLEIERLRTSAVESAKKIEETIKGRPKEKFEDQFNLDIGPACETKSSI